MGTNPHELPYDQDLSISLCVCTLATAIELTRMGLEGKDLAYS